MNNQQWVHVRPVDHETIRLPTLMVTPSALVKAAEEDHNWVKVQLENQELMVLLATGPYLKLLADITATASEPIREPLPK